MGLQMVQFLSSVINLFVSRSVYQREN